MPKVAYIVVSDRHRKGVRLVARGTRTPGPLGAAMPSGEGGGALKTEENRKKQRKKERKKTRARKKKTLQRPRPTATAHRVSVAESVWRGKKITTRQT